ncbi:MAG: TIGR04211 family SH3 domain-containing protein [bacterium]|nr:TIGR04211 family SH3 domain-containing protein [bacterium]
MRELAMAIMEQHRADRWKSRHPLRLACLLLAGIMASVSLPSFEATAEERAWVRGEIRLNLRSGPGTKYRILAGVATGDGLAVLSRGEGWTQVRMEDETEGWIPEGYLKPEPPPTVRLQQLEVEVANLRTRLSSVSTEADELKTTNKSLSSNDSVQREEIDRLILDNTKLRAGARYPELIAGASILAAGMILGAMLHRSSSSRRPASRIRL